MIVNLLLVGFLGFMAYWWSTQGMFSSLLHLVSVIVAGALAFALWEPMTYSAFMRVGFGAPYAWGLALIVPFVIILWILRAAGDKLIGRNMHFIPIVSQIGGGLLGAVSGVLAAGITILGISFMQLGPSFAGYQPFVVDPSGKVIDNSGGGLWVGVDKMAANFFGKLSVGAFSPRNQTPLKEYQPDLPQQAGLFRMGLDENASVIAMPDTVSVTGLYTQSTPVPGLTEELRKILGPEVAGPAYQLVVADSKWSGGYGTYDGDQTLRLSPTQVRLVTRADDGEMKLHAPRAAATMDGPIAPRKLIALDNDKAVLAGLHGEDTFGFIFVIPAKEEPRFLLARHSRFSFPKPVVNDPGSTITALGAPPSAVVEAPAVTPGPNVGPRTGVRTGSEAFEAVVDSNLPRRVPTSLVPSGISYNESGEIIEGKGLIPPPDGGMGSSKNVLEKIQTPGQKAMVRVGLSQANAQETLGKALAAAASLAGPLLTDSNGNTYEPIGYVWYKQSGHQDVGVDRIQPIRSSRQLPVREMGAEDHIYLYFLVNHGSSITEYSVGQTKQEVNLNVP